MTIDPTDYAICIVSIGYLTAAIMLIQGITRSFLERQVKLKLVLGGGPLCMGFALLILAIERNVHYYRMLAEDCWMGL